MLVYRCELGIGHLANRLLDAYPKAGSLLGHDHSTGINDYGRAGLEHLF